MANDRTVQTQQNTPSQNASQAPSLPFAMPMFGAEMWKQAMDTWMGRMVAMTEEAAKVEAAGAERARATIDESARLMRESLAYTMGLSSEWRRLVLESTRQMIATGTAAATPSKQG